VFVISPASKLIRLKVAFIYTNQNRDMQKAVFFLLVSLLSLTAPAQRFIWSPDSLSVCIHPVIDLN